MKKQTIRFAIFWGILFSSNLFNGCSQPTVTTLNDGSGNLGQWAVPGLGTSFVFLDSAQGVDTVRVLLNAQHIGGKQNVLVAVNVTQDGFPDTTWFNIEPNGDFSFGSRSELDSAGFFISRFIWQTFPVMSQKTIVQSGAVDSVEQEEHLIESTSCSFIGQESVQTPIGTYLTLHARSATVDDQIAIDSSLGFSFTDTVATDYWFASSLGMYIREQNSTTEDGSVLSESSMKLIEYLPR